MKQILPICIFIFLCSTVSAQKQTWQWYFGYNASMEFNTGTPVATFNSAMSQWEGCSSIADDNGDLLFYTDGSTVWNKNHQVMPNGSGMFGDYSSTQSALIVPKPGSTTIYYIFSCNGFSTYYSELDITLNGGLGDITANKNILLSNNGSEQLAGVWASNGQDIWVAIHDNYSSVFEAFLVTSAGVGTAITSNVGILASGGPGQLKFSPDGKRAAMGTIEFYNYETIALFDFDNSTGIFSHHIGLTTAYNQTYGLEFSPNSKVLYSGEYPGVQNVHQWNLDLPDALIQSSDVTIGVSLGSTASFQLAIDGKIYFAQDGTTYVGSISNPDAYGGAVYNNTAVNVSPNILGLGLPNFIASFFQSVNAEHFCFGDATNFYLSDSASYSSVYWNFDDPASGAANIDSGVNVFHVFTDTGEYNIQTIKNNGNVDTVYTTITIIPSPVVNLGSDTSICEGDSLLIDAGNAGSSFLWSDGSTSQTLSVSSAGIYSVAVSDGTCTGVDTIFVSTINCNQLPAFNSSDTDVCQKFCVDFFDLTLNSFEWHWTFEGGSPSSSTAQNPTSICYNLPGTYDVTLISTNANGTDTLTLPNYITVNATPPFPVITQAGYTLTSTPATSYQWQLNSYDISGATNQSYTITQSGYYTVIVSDSNGCVNSASIKVTINGIDDVMSDANISIYPNPSSGSFMVEWLNGLMTGDEVSIDVVNTIGQNVFTSSEKVSSPHFSKEIDLGDVAHGVYFVEIKTGRKFLRMKIIVVK